MATSLQLSTREALCPLATAALCPRDPGRSGRCVLSAPHPHPHSQAIWMMEPKDVDVGQHEEFYRFIAQAHDKPRYTLHYKADAPLSIRSIFYVPELVSRPGSTAGLNARHCLGEPAVAQTPLPWQFCWHPLNDIYF